MQKIKKNDKNSIHAVVEHVKDAVSRAQHNQGRLFHAFSASLQHTLLNENKNPQLKNVFSFVFSEKQSDVHKAKEAVVRKCSVVQSLLKQHADKVSDAFVTKVKDGATIVVQGVSSELFSAVKKARAAGKKVALSVVESLPGRIDQNQMTQLLREGVSVKFFPGIAARQAVKHADMVVLNADAVTSKKVISIMGGELLAELAARRNIPVYAVATGWKVHDKILLDDLHESEQQNAAHLFEQIDNSLVTSVISEKGVHDPAVFVELVKRERRS